MAREDYQIIFIDWHGTQVEIAFQSNWLNSENWHVELRSEEPLPVTTTGYRSAFFPAQTFAGVADISTYVLAWLEEEAEQPRWRRLVEENRQLKLF